MFFAIKSVLALVKFSPRRSYRFAFAIGLATALAIASILWHESFTVAQPASRTKATSSAYQVIVPPIYDEARIFYNGLAAVKQDDPKHPKVENWGFIDKQGKIVIPLTLSAASNFSEGLAAVDKGGGAGIFSHSGYIDKTGKFTIPNQLDGTSDFSEGLAAVLKDWQYAYIDRTGKIVISYKFDDASRFSEGLAAVKLKVGSESKWGYIDKTGQVVIPPQFEDTGDTPDYPRTFKAGLVAVKLKGKWGFVDRTNKILIPFQFDAANDFSEGLAAVKKVDKWGYIDRTGKVVIPLQYDDDAAISIKRNYNNGLKEVYSFSEGLAAVKLNNKWGYIDQTGKTIIPFQYDSTLPFSETLSATWKMKEGKWNFIDHIGKVIIPTSFTDVSIFSEGMAWFQTDNESRSKYGYISKQAT